ncbi:MAG: DUF3488 and transglutaminase-like domain-containing protein [Nitrospirota bacterium]
MPQLYKGLTFILALAGCISLLISGEINYFLSFSALALFAGYYRFFRNLPHAPKWVIGGLSGLTLLVFLIDSLMISDDYFIAVAHLTITFQAIKSFDLREPWDHLQVYFMSLLQLIVASELTHSIAFGFIFVLFLIALVAAIVYAHFVKEGKSLGVSISRPVLAISLMVLMLTAVLFVSIPRVTGGLWGKTHKKGIRTIGFSERVDFGSFGDLKSDSTIVLRVELAGESRRPYYWRGISLNDFDGISWNNTMSVREGIYRDGERFLIKPFEEAMAVIQKIYLEPMDTDVIFGLTEMKAVESQGRVILTDRAGSIFMPLKKGKRFSYVAYSVPGDIPVTGTFESYLQIPPGVEKISRLARSLVTENESDIEKAVKIEKYLRDNYSYSLSVPEPPRGINPVEDFLFRTKRGYCEHYATAMVLMMRSIDIPARIVTGFLGGELNEIGNYLIVRQSDAHSWAEAAIGGKWKLFDPTPPVSLSRFSGSSLFLDMLKMKWSRYIVSFSTDDQKTIVKTFTIPKRLTFAEGFRAKKIVSDALRFLILMLICIALLTGMYFLRRRYPGRYSFVTAQYISLRKYLKKKGMDINPSLTSSEIQREAARNGPSLIREFLIIYEEHRFGGKKMTGQDRERYNLLLKEIKKQISR